MISPPPPTPRPHPRPFFGSMLANIVEGGDPSPVPVGPAFAAASPRGGALLEAVQAMPSAAASVAPPLDPKMAQRTSGGMGRGQIIAGILADMLAGAQGRPGMFAQQMLRRQETEDERAEWHKRASLEREMQLRRLNQPQFTNVPGVGHVAVDPTTLRATVVQPSRTDAENYAETLGFERGTPDYNRAIADYALRGNGPTAFEQRTELQDDNQEAALDRLLRSLSLQQQLGLMRDGTTRRGQDLTAGTARMNEGGRNSRFNEGQNRQDRRFQQGQAGQNQRAAARGGRGRGGNSARATLNGRTIVVRNGAWVDEQTGAPVR